MKQTIEISRRKSRINAIKILYIAQFNSISIDSAYNMLIDEEDENNIINYDQEAIKFANDVYSDIKEIDTIIENSLTNYTISRLNYVDLAIIRLCTKEMLLGTDPSICINEAIEISKRYSDLDDNKASKFNNRLLQNIKESILGE